jgi:hypothetical protein
VPISGFSVRGDFQGGALSADFGAMLLSGVDQQIGLIGRLAGRLTTGATPCISTIRCPTYWRNVIFQVVCGYEDGNDANSLRHDPVFKLTVRVV